MTNLHKVFTNTITGQKYVQPKPSRPEKKYEGGMMITETDLNGIITYANRKFLEFSGFSRRELIGMPHSIMRHPDNPKGVYKAMWEIISQKKVWRGYIKSLCRDGSYYWALVYIQPKLDGMGNIKGYIASRRDAYPSAISEVEKKYQQLQGDEHMDDPYFKRMELHHGEGLATFESRLSA
ncbi:PAS domain-containing protein [Sulfurovum riftiae]|uniref:PAS domain-containing protein n=1 Tax=Sulfurovum riftiae TaxID=1630136 RepID=UPI0008299DFC|nr:PAS domain S-box protein [Sulfurovum riftiae]